MHARCCFRSWPRAEINRLRLRSSRQCDFEVARDLFVQELKRVVHDQDLLRTLASAPFVAPFNRKQRDRDALRSFWLALPFHPLLERGKVGSTASAVTHLWLDVLGHIAKPFKVRLAWRNPSGHMYHGVQGRSVNSFFGGSSG